MHVLPACFCIFQPWGASLDQNRFPEFATWGAVGRVSVMKDLPLESSRVFYVFSFSTATCLTKYVSYNNTNAIAYQTKASVVACVLDMPRDKNKKRMVHDK